MTPKPLDPCPVCRRPTRGLFGDIKREYDLLSAEVALARVVMEHGDTIREYIDGVLSVDRAHPRAVFDLDDAIARVREASK